MRKFLITYPDNKVSVVTVIDDSTNQEIIAKCHNYQTNTSYRDILDTDIPSGREAMRHAWEDSQPGTQIDISHQAAKDCALETLRAKRQPELDRLDGLKLRADELGDTALSNSIVADKNALRNCTDDLKTITDTGYNDDTILDDIQSKCVLPALTN